MPLTPHDVARLAALARIDLSQAELEQLAPPLWVPRRGYDQVGASDGEDAPLEVSASQLRELLSARADTRDLMPGSVRRYIDEHGLYTALAGDGTGA